MRLHFSLSLPLFPRLELTNSFAKIEYSVPLFASLSSPAATASAIWEHESKLVERLLVAAIAEEKAEEARKKNAGEAKVEEVVVEEEGRKER